MELIKEFERICSQIGEHVGYEGWVESYQINTADIDSFWQSFDNDINISWAETKEDILEERVRFLEEFIVNSGLEIPYPKVENNNEEDWLPF